MVLEGPGWAAGVFFKSDSGRTEAFIMSKVTGFPEKASQAKNEQLPRAAAEESPALPIFWGWWRVGGIGG